jgi:hypothetical protein
MQQTTAPQQISSHAGYVGTLISIFNTFPSYLYAGELVPIPGEEHSSDLTTPRYICYTR